LRKFRKDFGIFPFRQGGVAQKSGIGDR
jgi:hypothetical protein